jgi:hypothetical protein
MHHVSNRPDHDGALATGSALRNVRETESIEQRRANLCCALAAAEQSVQRFPAGLAAHQKAKARVSALQNELRVLNGRAGTRRQRHDLGDIIISIVKERVSAVEWKGILSEAKRRHNVQGLSGSVIGLSASA